MRWLDFSHPAEKLFYATYLRHTCQHYVQFGNMEALVPALSLVPPPKARAQRSVEAFARQHMAMLAPCILTGRPKRERTPWLVLGSQSSQNVLAVDTAILRPRAGTVAG
jgi:hypothetical protein